MSWIIYFVLSVLIMLMPFTAVSAISDRIEVVFFDKNLSSIAKGIGILSVMLCHFMGRFGGGTVLFTPLGGIGVAIFLVLSGYGLSESWTRGGGYSCWWRKRILAVIVPYALIEIICYWPFHEFSFIGFMFDVLCIKPLYHNGWYLQYLLLWYVIFYIIMRAADHFHLGGEKKILVFSLVSIILFFILDEICAEQSLSFWSGIVLSEKKEKIGKITKWQTGILLILCGIVFLSLKQLDSIRSAPQVIFNLVQLGIKWPIGIGVIILCYLVAGKINLKLFAWVGTISYELYLIHGYVLPNVEGITGAVLFWLGSVILAMVFNWFIERIFPTLKKLICMKE